MVTSVNGIESLLVISLAGQRFALRISAVVRVLRPVEVIPLPDAPEIVSGLINYHGKVIPLLNVGRLLLMPGDAPGFEGALIVVRIADRLAAIHADDVVGPFDFSAEDIVPPDDILPGLGRMEGVAVLRDGIAYIYDLGRFFLPGHRALLEGPFTLREAACRESAAGTEPEEGLRT
jgi:purine-binding chemotaxis protein CheW